MKYKILWYWLCFFSGPYSLAQSGVLTIENGSDAALWQTAPTEGVDLHITESDGENGHSIRIDYNFNGKGGWAAAVKPVRLVLPENFVLSYRVRGETPLNKLEIKLQQDANVWWYVQPSFNMPEKWTEQRIKRRKISFAWGPESKRPLEMLSAFEFTIVAEKGGKGTIWLDDIRIEPRAPDAPYTLTPIITTSSGSGQGVLSKSRVWSPKMGSSQWLTIDFGTYRELGGVTLDWASGGTRYQVAASDDGKQWRNLMTVQNGDGGYDALYLPETEVRFIRLTCFSVCVLRQFQIEEVSFSTTPSAYIAQVASRAPEGHFPLYFLQKLTYWTVWGAPHHMNEGLMSEHGIVELEKGGPSFEPFVMMDGKLWSWANATHEVALENGYLPIPNVTRMMGQLELKVTAWANQEGFVVQYKLHNHSKKKKTGYLYLAVRPFQVNPTSQFLNTPGGFAPITSLSLGQRLQLNQTTFTTTPVPEMAWVTRMSEGDLIAQMTQGRSTRKQAIKDSLGFASGAMQYAMKLMPGASQTVVLYYGTSGGVLEQAKTEWRHLIERFDLVVPGEEALTQSIKANLGYVLVNQDENAIQPGSRSYERSWIRDGSLTSAALLRLGHADTVREYLLWYARFLFDNGKVPCCVDYRGPDPVPENDSHGQFIYLVAEYFRFTNDQVTLRQVWPQVQNAVRYMEELRHLRRTPEYQTPEKKPYFGLLPESISHEGYSDHPRHSFWDYFFAIRGYKDATYLAEALGEKETAERFKAFQDEFTQDVHAAIRATMALHQIDYLPGCVELGDFDATSTTVGITPAEEMARFPEGALEKTFERYWEFAENRRSGKKAWENYTPYEWRTVGALLRLGWKERAHTMSRYFFSHQRPAAWRHWAEVIWREERTPKFIGDMPHTWVGSDFIRAILSFFAYEREDDQTLVIGAGLLPEWLEKGQGVRVKNIGTWWGSLSYNASRKGGTTTIQLLGSLKVPQGGIEVHIPDPNPIREIWINNHRLEKPSHRINVHDLPATVVVHQ